MKHLLLSALLLALTHSAGAQRYTISPTYLADCTWMGSGDPMLKFDQVDTFTAGSFVVDLDRKVIETPFYNYGPQIIIPITKIVRENANLLILTAPKDKDRIYQSEQYHLRLDDQQQPVSLTHAISFKARHLRNVVGYKKYTAQLSSLSFYQVCSTLRQDTTDGDDMADYRKDAVFMKPEVNSYNIFEMRDGKFYHTTGKGRNATKRVYQINQVKRKEGSAGAGITFTCREQQDGPTYVVSYFQRKEKTNYPAVRYIIINRFDGRKLTAVSVYTY